MRGGGNPNNDCQQPGLSCPPRCLTTPRHFRKKSLACCALSKALVEEQLLEVGVIKAEHQGHTLRGAKPRPVLQLKLLEDLGNQHGLPHVLSVPLFLLHDGVLACEHEGEHARLHFEVDLNDAKNLPEEHKGSPQSGQRVLMRRSFHELSRLPALEHERVKPDDQGCRPKDHELHSLQVAEVVDELGKVYWQDLWADKVQQPHGAVGVDVGNLLPPHLLRAEPLGLAVRRRQRDTAVVDRADHHLAGE
eukprot:CAMPEP_0171098434 /NCGR_PEP_ID=MMETSP0766_2-20121228/48277_1 /TAXON_ID=439317 /ORGANISM="Gambierdiscus australes, Strain CAWD 149" /LENGTH=247 /DNA_ID=CAMNT_0011557773 /DNA_START=89 /DNA_END=833 /DNA_ORIENTATION=+